MLFVLCLTLCSPELQSQNANRPDEQQAKPEESRPRTPVDPKRFALIIAGVGGEEAYTRKFTAQALQLRDALTTSLGYDEKQVFLLAEPQAAGPEDAVGEPLTRATADEARKAFGTIKAAVQPDSFVLIVLIGHGSFDGQEAKFNLIGPDLTMKDYASLIGSIPAKRVVFVNCSSSSGEFVKPLSGKDRIIITATRSGNEQNVTIFAENFIGALTNPAADADKSGRTSVQEAFNYATKLTAEWYKQKGRLATEHALIDDNGDGVGHEEATAGDGALAKTTYIDAKTDEQAGADAEVIKLLDRRQGLEEEIEKLKLRKDTMKPEEYEAELERLLVELATVNQTIKERKK
jgi:hypothetical protein